jgi:hypothetical protein
MCGLIGAPVLLRASNIDPQQPSTVKGPVAPAHHLLTDGAHTPGRRSTLLG